MVDSFFLWRPESGNYLVTVKCKQRFGKFTNSASLNKYLIHHTISTVEDYQIDKKVTAALYNILQLIKLQCVMWKVPQPPKPQIAEKVKSLWIQS